MPISPHKPKPQRIETPGTARFLTFGCYQRKRVFRFNPLCSIFRDHLQYQADKLGIHVWSYVIMHNHVHLMVYSASDTPVREFLTVLKQRTARKGLHWLAEHQQDVWTSLHDSKGQPLFWQRGGGYDRSLWTPEHVAKALEYIHDNPVRAGLVTDAVDYAWSSCKEWNTGEFAIVNPAHVPVA